MAAAKPVPVNSSGCPVHAEDFDWPAPETIECPFPYLQALRDEAPVYKYPGRDEYIVSRWQDIAEVSRRTDVFSNRITADADPNFFKTHASTADLERGDGRFTPFSMAHSDPPEHKEKRALGLRVISHQKIDPELIRGLADELIDRWIDDGSCSFREDFSDWLPVSVIVRILGLTWEKLPLYKQWGESEGAGARYASEAQLRREAENRRHSTQEWQRQLLDRYERPRRDSLSELVRAQVERDGELDLDYLVKETEVLVFAGNVTTAHTLASAMVFLCQDPELMRRVRGDRTTIPALIDETLRLESPVQWRQRWATQDVEIGGVKISRGAQVIVMYNSGNRDERRWAEPDAFDLERPDVAKHNLAFGHGIHRCLGAPLARLESEIAIDRLLTRLRDIRLDEERSDLSHIDSVHFRAPKVVSLTFAKA